MSGRFQSWCHKLIATPQRAIAHCGSSFSICWNCFSASSYQNECSIATTLNRLLHRRPTGRREMHRPQLRLGHLFVMMALVCRQKKGITKDNCAEEKICFHGGHHWNPSLFPEQRR